MVTLRAQYRMAAPIMALANGVVYGGALAAGSPAVAARRLALPSPPAAPLPRWLQEVRPPQTPCSSGLVHCPCAIRAC